VKFIVPLNGFEYFCCHTWMTMTKESLWTYLAGKLYNVWRIPSKHKHESMTWAYRSWSKRDYQIQPLSLMGDLHFILLNLSSMTEYNSFSRMDSQLSDLTTPSSDGYTYTHSGKKNLMRIICMEILVNLTKQISLRYAYKLDFL